MSSDRIYSFGAIADENSKILILGTAPSVMSLKEGMFYGHPHNKFWKILSAILNNELPKNNEEKRQLLLQNGIALWDTLHSCERPGSSLDSYIKQEVPNDIPALVNKYKGISHVFLNGGASLKYYKKYSAKNINIGYTVLPSTSPANATVPFDKKLEQWSVIKNYL